MERGALLNPAWRCWQQDPNYGCCCYTMGHMGCEMLIKDTGNESFTLASVHEIFSQLNHSDYSSPIEAAELEQDVVPGSEQ